MLGLKFHQNRTINEKYDFWRVKAPPEGAGRPHFKKSLIQKGGPKPHQKFQHSRLIRKCLKIGEIDPTFSRVKGPPRGAGRPHFE